MDEMALIWKNSTNLPDIGDLRNEIPRRLCYEVSIEFHRDLINTSSFFEVFRSDRREHQVILPYFV